MEHRRIVIIIECIVVLVWIFLWLNNRKENYITANVTNVISVKPLESEPYYLIKYTHDKGTDEYIGPFVPQSPFKFKKLDNGKIILRL
jgi:hypothetical protein